MVAQALASLGEHEGVGAHGAGGEEVHLEAGGGDEAGQEGQEQEHIPGAWSAHGAAQYCW